MTSMTQDDRDNTPDDQEWIECPSCKRTISREKLASLPARRCQGCDLPLLTLLGKYEIVRELARGGHGVVYLARHKSLPINPMRAVKFLSPDIQDEVTQRRFLREFQIMAGISQESEHIVRVFDDFGEEPDLGYFFIMEYLQGKDLSQFRPPHHELLPLRHVLSIVHQICIALEVAHRAGVIHRDIKPENVIVLERDDNPCFAKVGDFGIAKLLDAKKLTGPGGGLGTPLYMSPEQIASQTQDHRSDIYSLGMVFYELVMGFSPFVRPDQEKKPGVMDVLRAHMEEEPPRPNELQPGVLPPELEDLLMRCIAKAPEDRIQHVRTIKQALEEHLTLLSLSPGQEARIAHLQGLPPEGTDENIPRIPTQVADIFKETPSRRDEESLQAGVDHARTQVTEGFGVPDESTAPTGEHELTTSTEADVPTSSTRTRRTVVWLLLIGALFLLGGFWLLPKGSDPTPAPPGDGQMARSSDARGIPAAGPPIDERTQGCPADPPKGMWVRINPLPLDLTLKSSLKLERHKEHYCLLMRTEPHRQFTVTITSKDFHTCHVTRVRLQRYTDIELLPQLPPHKSVASPEYCIKSQRNTYQTKERRKIP